MNFLTIAGNVGKAPELRTVGGETVLTFSVADNWVAKGEKRTVWFNCELWGTRAAKMADYIRQGEKITVCGQLRPREFRGKDGDLRTSYDVRVSELALQGAKESGGKVERPAEEVWQAGAAGSADDIPF